MLCFLLSKINTKIVRRLKILTILFFYIFQNFLIRNIQNSYNFSYGFNFSFVLIFHGNIEECFVSGNIKCEGKSNAKCRAGGLAGTLSGNIKNCYNKANINGKGKIANCR